MKVQLQEIRLHKFGILFFFSFNIIFRSDDSLHRNSVKKQTEGHLLYLIFSNLVENLLEFLQKIVLICNI